MQRAAGALTKASSSALFSSSLVLPIASTSATFTRFLHSSQCLHSASPAGEAADPTPAASSPKASTSSAQPTPNLKDINRSIRMNTKLQVHGDISYAVGIVAEMKRRQDHYLELLAAKARMSMKKAQAEAPLTTSLLAAMQAQAQQYGAAKQQPGAGQKQE